MLINLLISIQIICFTVAEVYNGPIFDQSEPKSSQHIWHSYKFNTGAGNREELYISNAGLDHNFESISGVSIWRNLQAQEQVVIVGLADHFLTVKILNEGENLSTYEEELQGSAKALSVFQKWNAKTQEIENFAVVATYTTADKFIIKWYQVLDRRLKFLWDWPFHENLTYLDVIKINYEPKLLIVNQGSVHKSPSAEIYNFDVNSDLDIWLFEKIKFDAVPSSVSVFETNNNIFFCASFPSLEIVHIFKYIKTCTDTLEKKHFVSHQKIFSDGLKSVISFRVGFWWHLAVASRTSLIYSLGENLLFEPVGSQEFGSLKNWLAIPVDTYREDMMLLADSGSDVSVISWNGDDHMEVLGSFSELACENDVNFSCLERIKHVTMNGSTTFGFGGHQNVIMPTQNGSTLFLKLLVKLKPVPDKVTLKLQDIENIKKALEKNYMDQNKQIMQLLSKEPTSEFQSTGFPVDTHESRKIPETEAQTKNLGEILSDFNRLKGTVEGLNRDVNEFLTVLKTQLLHQNQSGQESTSASFLRNDVAEGMTFYGDVLIEELNLSSLNGYSVNELLADSFRKNRINKIGGKKTLKQLRTENLIFEKIGDTPACDIVFSDDACDERSKNVINGDIIWDGSLSIINDVNILPESSSRNDSLNQSPRGIFKHVYDELNLEELQVTNDTHIQRTINGKPFILPVHSGHLNVLDIVNQARIEFVNVKQNLNVGFINGKNFSSLFESMLLKPPAKRDFDTVKVEKFSAPDIKTNKLNNMKLTNGTATFDVRLSEKRLLSDRNYYVIEKRARNQNLRRVIHVIQNLEVDGIVFSKKINNISWTVLNDTVKKSEQTVTLPGTKTFERVLTAKTVRLNGTLNGRFADNVLNNFSEQTIRFPQVLDNVNFRNLTLKGTWNGVSLDRLNKSVLRLSSNNERRGDFTFGDVCFVNVLNVSSSVNDVDLKDGSHGRIIMDKINLKSIKASNITLYGSLVTNNNINNMNMSNFSLLRVSLKSPETIDEPLFHPNVTVFGDLNLETLNMNDVQSIINSGGDTNLIEMFLNGEIQRIKKLLVKGNITAANGVNGYNVTEILERGVSITKPVSVGGNITFENIVHFDNVNVTGFVDGFSLKHLERDIAFKHSHVFLNAPKNFTTIKVTRNVKARSLNGHLMQDVVALKGDETMKGPVHINGDVIVKGNITSFSAVNNITVTNLLRSFSTKFNSFIYPGDLNLRSDHVTVRNLIVNGSIQNVSLEELVNDAVLKEESFSITGRKTFKGEVKFKENVSVEGFVHGLNFSSFFPDIILINKPTKLKGTVTLHEAVLKTLETSGYFNSTLINNLNTNDWLEDCVPLDRNEVISGKKVFENAHTLQDISVDFINGHLPTAMIPLKKKQYIPSVALFPRIHTTSDLSVAGNINGINLLRELEDTVLVQGDQTIYGKTLFDNEFVINGNLYVDTVQGKPVNSLITLDSEQVIKIPLEFKGLVMAKKGVEKLEVINNISLSEWSRKSVSLNQEQVLNGIWTVKGKTRAKNVQGEGLIHSMSLPNVSKDLRQGRLLASERKNATEMEFSEQCHRVEELSKRFSGLPYLFDQFDISGEIETSSVVDSVVTFKVNGTNHLIVTFINDCMSLLYKWNRTEGAFEFVRHMNIGFVSKWSIIYRNNATYLITSSFRSSKICEENLKQGNVWIFKENPDKYEHLLTSNAFVDIIHENGTSENFYTVDESGILQQWTLEKNGSVSSKFLLNIGPGHYRFIDFRVMGGLAISDGREIKQITLTDDKVIENNISFMNNRIVPLPIDGKTLIAVVVKDKIIVYENLIDEKIFSVIHTYKAGSVLWFNYGPEKQAFLIVASHHKLIEVYEYKSVSGLVRTMSIQMFSSRLQSETLPAKEKDRSDKYLIVIQKKKLIFIKAKMMGDFYKADYSLC